MSHDTAQRTEPYIPHASTAREVEVPKANGWEDPGGWNDASAEGAQLLPHGATAEKPLAGASVPSPDGDAEQWQTTSGLLLYALCTLCSSGESSLDCRIHQGNNAYNALHLRLGMAYQSMHQSNHIGLRIEAVPGKLPYQRIPWQVHSANEHPRGGLLHGLGLKACEHQRCDTFHYVRGACKPLRTLS